MISSTVAVRPSAASARASSVPRGSALALAVLCGACAQQALKDRPRAPAAAEKTLADAERSRRDDPQIKALLADRDPVIRARAALAAGRTQKAGALEALSAALASDIGSDAAWALGRIPGGEPALVRCVVDSCPAAAEAARALGGPGRGPEATAALTNALGGPATLAAEAATALGILGRMGGKGADVAVRDAAGAALLKALARPELEVRTGAAYALGRIAKLEAGPRLPQALQAALADPDPVLRSLAARAAGRQGAFATALSPLLRDPDWRVRVEAARALAQAPGGPEALAAGLPAAMTDAGGVIREISGDSKPGAPVDLRALAFVHALEAHLEAMGKAGGAAAAQVPHPEALSAGSAAATVTVRCAAALARDRGSNDALLTPKCGAGLEPGWRGRVRAAALAAELTTAETSPARAAALAAFADPDGRVRSAAASNAGPPLTDALLKALEDPDPFVVASAAGSLAKDPKVARHAADAAAAAVARLSDARSKVAGDPAADALLSLVKLIGAQAKPAFGTPPGLAVLEHLAPVASIPLYAALDEALAALGGSRPDASLAPSPSVPAEATAGLPGNGPRPSRLRLKTTAGDLVIALRGGDGEAPLTSAALAALAGRGFYNGLPWHRVVPDFVVQGGDSRGDGDGGPGWSLPDEHTPLRFKRGTLGIATSGAETGGSQIFLCHAPQPHLDGRYTIAGELIEGAEVMDALHVGDSIVSASAE